jgi:hypothetical protein
MFIRPSIFSLSRVEIGELRIVGGQVITCHSGERHTNRSSWNNQFRGVLILYGNTNPMGLRMAIREEEADDRVEERQETQQQPTNVGEIASLFCSQQHALNSVTTKPSLQRRSGLFGDAKQWIVR